MAEVTELRSEQELQDNIEEIERLNLSIDISKLESKVKLIETIKTKFCGERFFISLPNISKLTHLPIYYPDCGPIIDISANDVVEINSFDDIIGSTKDFKTLLVHLNKFEIEMTEKMFEKIVIDYKNSVEVYVNENSLLLEQKNMENISANCPLGIWVALE